MRRINLRIPVAAGGRNAWLVSVRADAGGQRLMRRVLGGSVRCGEPDGVWRVDDGAGRLPSLADTIAAVGRELGSGLAAGPGQQARFRAGPVELDFEIAVTCTDGGPAGVHLSVLTLGGQSALASATTQRIKVMLVPLDRGAGQGARAAAGLESAVSSSAAGGLPERPVRADGLEVQEVADGLIVYQAEPECVHHLNNTAAVVFELCDGEHTVPEIGEELAAVFGLGGVPADVAERCIADLWAKNVVL